MILTRKAVSQQTHHSPFCRLMFAASDVRYPWNLVFSALEGTKPCHNESSMCFAWSRSSCFLHTLPWRVHVTHINQSIHRCKNTSTTRCGAHVQKNIPDAVKEIKESIVLATMDVYKTSMSQLLPTPTKSHYLFNLRDISRVISGLLLLSPTSLGTGTAAKEKFIRLWVHEMLRVFYDRRVATQLPAVK